MRKSFVFSLLFCLGSYILAQDASLTGFIVDLEDEEPLIGASVKVINQNIGGVTDISGKFKINNLSKGEYSLTISYVGYIDKELKVNIKGGINNVNIIKLKTSNLDLKELEVIADIVKERVTPVAATTISAKYIQENLGNQEFPEILRNTPSVYVTKEGGGFGDSRINVRGFEQNNIAVMVNGVPVNDMESGWVYWSNWSGLADVTNKMQIQRGLGASKLAIPAVGGTINILTNAAEFKKGGNVSSSIGNDGYTKYVASLSSGLSEKGFAATMQLTYNKGNGYIQGTDFKAYSYFLSSTYNINEKHRVSATIIGAPQVHNRRTIHNFYDSVSLATFRCPENDSLDRLSKGIKFNPGWGMLNGEVFSWRKNFYHKPKAFINHYWNFSEYTKLKTAAYFSLGNGGGTSARGRGLQNDNIEGFSGYDSFQGFGVGIHDSSGQVMFDSIIAYNQGEYVAAFGGYNEQADTVRDYPGGNSLLGDGWIRTASMNRHIWYGIISTFEHNFNENLSFVAGVDARYYVGQHYRKVENLLGNNTYLSSKDVNNPENFIDYETGSSFGSFSENSHLNNNTIQYHNDGIVKWLGGFTQIEYSSEKFSVFSSLSLSNQGFKRVDHFNYLDDDTLQTTDWQIFNGGTLKAGLNYNLSKNSRLFFNAGYFSKQPIFNTIFLRYRNIINETAKNQTVEAYEIGYSFFKGDFDLDINAYYTEWANRQFTRNMFLDNQDVLYVFDNISQTHQGVEMEFNFKLSKKYSLTGMVSIGDWIYTSNFNATGTVLDLYGNPTEDVQDSVLILYGSGLKVGDAAQHTYSLTFKYKPIKGLSINATYYVADQLYAPYNIFEDQFYQEGGQVTKLPIYGIARLGIFYRKKINDKTISLRLNINNLLNTLYIAELNTNSLNSNGELYTPNQVEFYTKNKGYYGFGRTWNFGFKLSF
ncbi:MAG: TonB-dependent receptor [Flavobacteriales bacterium]